MKFLKDLRDGVFTTDYSHENKITLKDGKPHLLMDCSGLALHLLNQHSSATSVSDELRHFVLNVKYVNPRLVKRFWSFDFFDLFNAVNSRNYISAHFEPVLSHNPIQPGNILVYLPPPKEKRRYGHMGVVMSSPVKVSDKGVSVDFLHAPTFGKPVTLENLYLRSKESREFDGISYSSKKMTTKQVIIGRPRIVSGLDFRDNCQ